MDRRGIEPRASRMQSERSTTELHPPLIRDVKSHIFNSQIVESHWKKRLFRIVDSRCSRKMVCDYLFTTLTMILALSVSSQNAKHQSSRERFLCGPTTLETIMKFILVQSILHSQGSNASASTIESIINATVKKFNIFPKYKR